MQPPSTDPVGQRYGWPASGTAQPVLPLVGTGWLLRETEIMARLGALVGETARRLQDDAGPRLPLAVADATELAEA